MSVDDTMRAWCLRDGRYHLEIRPLPRPAADEVSIRVAYAGVNRIDLLQRQGRYPLPVAQVPGLEVAGEIVALGSQVNGWALGDKVAALLSEGGFAEYAAAPASLLLPVTGALDLAAAACLPEACFTASLCLHDLAGLRAGETCLIHGGASGIGTLAIQFAGLLGARVFATARSEAKRAACQALGAELAVDFAVEENRTALRDATGGNGVDVILDMVGGGTFEPNLALLARGGRLVVIGLMESARVNALLGPLLLNHLSVIGSTLRSRSLAEKAAIAAAWRQDWWKAALSGRIRPVQDHVFAWDDAEKALERMDQGLNIGKILLKL